MRWHRASGTVGQTCNQRRRPGLERGTRLADGAGQGAVAEEAICGRGIGAFRRLDGTWSARRGERPRCDRIVRCPVSGRPISECRHARRDVRTPSRRGMRSRHRHRHHRQRRSFDPERARDQRWRCDRCGLRPDHREPRRDPSDRQDAEKAQRTPASLNAQCSEPGSVRSIAPGKTWLVLSHRSAVPRNDRTYAVMALRAASSAT